MKLKVLVALIGFSMGSNAQEFKPKPVTVADLEEKVHSKDPTAAAAIVYKIGDCNISLYDDVGFQTKHTVKTRIKIYSKEGYGFAMQGVYFATGRNNAIVTFDDVVTYNLVDGKIVKIPIKKDGIFEEKVTRFLSQKKLQFPNVKEGSILEYTYTITAKGIMTPPKWSFQSKIPTNYSQFTTHIPEYLIFNTNQKGFLFPKVDKKQVYRPAGYEEVITTYTAHHMPGLKDEGFVSNIENFTSGIGHELSAVRLPTRYSYYSERVASDWGTIAKRLYEYDDFGGEIKKSGYYEKQVDSIAKGKSSHDDIVKAVFQFVKSKIKWNKRNGLGCENGVKRAMAERTGNVADINLMLVAMLRHLEIEASPVLISTRENGVVLFPSIDNFDYVIAGVQTTSGFTLLDATEEFALPNLLPMRDLNWYGRLIRENGTSEQIDLIPSILSKEIAFMTAQIAPGGGVSGVVKKMYTDYKALDFREKNINVQRDFFLESLEFQSGNITIDDYTREHEKDPSQALVEKYSFQDDQAIEDINGKLYFSPMLFFRLRDNPFKQEKREYPIDFGYPSQIKVNATFQLPEGYEIESLPQSLSMDTEDGTSTFKYVLASQGASIQLTVTTELKSALVGADAYTQLKTFFQHMVDKQNEKIVLKKI